MDILNGGIASLTPQVSCQKLNRTSININTCGDCLPTYVGDNFQPRTACVSASLAVVALKTCPNECSNNGSCTFVDIATSSTIEACLLQSTLCTAKCICNIDRYGDDCSMTRTQLIQVQQAQVSILTQLKTVSSVDVPTESLVVSLINSTLSLFASSNTVTMTDSSIDLSSSIISSNMKNAVSFNLSLASFSIYSNVINNFVDLTTSKSLVTSSRTSIQEMYESYANAVGLTALKTFNTSKSSNITISTPNMQLVVTKLRPLNTITSLSSNPSHELSVTSSKLGLRRLSVYDHNIPVVLSVVRNNMYETEDIGGNTTYYKLTSNPLRLQVDCSLMNKTQVKLVMYHSTSQSYSPILPITQPITTLCKKNHKASHSYMCEYTDRSTYNISVACDGSKNITYITTCPSRILSPTCRVNSNLGNCKLASSTSDKVICSCEVCSAAGARRRLSTDSDIYQFEGMVGYIYDEYSSITTSKSFSESTITGSVIVLVTFATVWVVIILIVPVRAMHKRIKKKKKRKTAKSKVNTAVVPEEVAHSITLEKRLRDYIKSCIPTVYDEQQGYMRRILTQLMRNHLYLNLFSSSHSSIVMSFLEAFRALTILTSSMFVLVILYNAEYPGDDKTCPTFRSERDCLARKTFRGRVYCTWEQDACNFSKEAFSMYTIVFLAWFELLILAPLGSLIMVIFHFFILAPTQSNVQSQFKVRHIAALGRRLSQEGSDVSSQLSSGARRLSLIGSQVTSGTRRLSTVIKSSAGVVKKKARSVRKTILLDDQLVEKRHNMVSVLVHNYHQRHRQHVIHLDGCSDHDIAQALYQKATESIKAYRRTLSDDEVVEFDRHWECYFPETDGSSGSKYDKFSQPLYSKISRTQELGSEDYSYLKDIPPHVCGVEILKTFFVDLLGRETEEAKIFQSTFEENLEAKHVVSIYLKVAMIALMMGLNIYFLYISILYCSDKSYQWQYNWLATFLTNFSIDVTFNCISEAYVLKYMVPMAINNKILLLNKKLNLLIDEIVSSCSNAVNSGGGSDHHRHHAFSSTDYFFVSTNIARRFMDVPESAIVLAYSDQHPIIKQIDGINENGNDSDSDDDDDDNDSNLYHCTIAALGAVASLLLQALTIVLLGLGQLPEMVQNLIIRILQPLAVSVFGFISLYISPYLVLVAVVIMIGYWMHLNSLAHMKTTSTASTSLSSSSSTTTPSSLSMSKVVPTVTAARDADPPTVTNIRTSAEVPSLSEAPSSSEVPSSHHLVTETRNRSPLPPPSSSSSSSSLSQSRPVNDSVIDNNISSDINNIDGHEVVMYSNISDDDDDDNNNGNVGNHYRPFDKSELASSSSSSSSSSSIKSNHNNNVTKPSPPSSTVVLPDSSNATTTVNKTTINDGNDHNDGNDDTSFNAYDVVMYSDMHDDDDVVVVNHTVNKSIIADDIASSSSSSVSSTSTGHIMSLAPKTTTTTPHKDDNAPLSSSSSSSSSVVSNLYAHDEDVVSRSSSSSSSSV